MKELENLMHRVLGYLEAFGNDHQHMIAEIKIALDTIKKEQKQEMPRWWEKVTPYTPGQSAGVIAMYAAPAMTDQIKLNEES